MLRKRSSIGTSPRLGRSDRVSVTRVDMESLPLIGQGRGCVVYDLGDGTVLRRYRNPSQSAEGEAAAMRRAAQAGVAVPRVHAVCGADIRMDRVAGPTMAGHLAAHPEQAESCGRILADLHRALDLTESGAGAALVHGDLHPLNVLMSPDGPVLIDWTNHRTGRRALDVALTWMVLQCFDPDDDAMRLQFASLRAALVRGFLGSVDVAAAAASLQDAAVIRHADPATSATEHTRIDRLLAVANAD